MKLDEVVKQFLLECEARSLTDQAIGFYRKCLTLFVRKLEEGGARGTRTLTALRPGDFKSPMSTISSSPLGWLLCCVALCGVDMILTCYCLFVNHLF